MAVDTLISNRKIKERIVFYFLALLSLFFLFVGVLNVKERISWKEPTDGIKWGESRKGVIVKEIFGKNVPEGIKVGDILIKINEHEILDLQDYYDVFFIYSPGDNVNYVFMDGKNGNVKSFYIKLDEKQIFQNIDIYRLILALIYILAGFLIFFRHREAKGSKHFFLVCLFSFALYTFKYTDRVTRLDVLVYFLSKFSLTMLPALFLHFCLTFPVKIKEKLGKTLIFFLYLPFLGIFLFELLWFLGKLERFNFPRSPSKKLFLDNLNIVYFSIYFLIAIIVLFLQRKKVTDIELKQQMKWIIAGVILSLFPFLIFYVIPLLLNMDITPLMQSSILSLGFMPISFSYAIVKYKLMDVDVIFKRGLIYFIASAVSLIVYFAILGLSGLIFKILFPESTFLTIAVSVLIAAFIFAPVRNWVQKEINRVFYKEEFELKNSLYELGRTLATQGNLKDMADSVFSIFNKILEPEKVAILEMFNQDKNLYKIVISSDNSLKNGELVEIPPELFLENRFLPYLKIPEHFEKMGLSYFFPLEIKDERIGAIGIGKSKSGKLLTSEDAYLIKVLSGYISVSFENIRLLNVLNKQLKDIKELKEFNERIISSINLGIIVFDGDGNIIIQNSAMENIIGAKGKSIWELFSEDFLKSISYEKKIVDIEENLFLHRFSYRNKRGEDKILNITLIPIKSEENRNRRLILVFNDITNRINLERELILREKENTITIISAGIAHEINTPLTAISSNLQMAMEDIEDEDIKNTIERARKECFRASRIVDNFLKFARLKTIEKRNLDIVYVVNSSLDLVMNLVKKKNIEIIKNFVDDNLWIYGNEGQLVQVFTNLILNAKDAIPENGGKILIEVKRNGKYVDIKVSDNGAGIPDDIKTHLFDPFFTTKREGKGTGLGLAVSNLIIQEHRGKIFVESEVGKGTTFIVKLPNISNLGGKIEG